MIASMFGNKKTVAGVMSAFHKTVEELKAVEIAHAEEAEAQLAAVAQAQAAHAQAKAESELARATSDRLLAVIGPIVIASIPDSVREDMQAA
jgi:hypothetical protein